MRAMGHGEKNYAYLTQKTKMKNIHEIHGPWRKELCIFNRKIKIKNFMRAMGHIKNISFSYIFFTLEFTFGFNFHFKNYF